MRVKTNKKKIRGTKELAYMIKEVMDKKEYLDQEKEHLYMVSLNPDGSIIALHEIAVGAKTSVTSVGREVFRPAIQDGAVMLAMAHNHPGGPASPSPSDVSSASSLKGLGMLLGIKLVDDIVIGPEGYSSTMHEKGRIFEW